MSTQSLNDFESAAAAVLAFLRKRFDFDLWMVTRVSGDDWIVLQREDQGYGVEPGTVFRWVDSLCYEMVRDNGPRIAPSTDRVPAYANAPIAQQVEINAYVGQPLVLEDGSLFGTLCGVDPSPQNESIAQEQDLVELFGALLSTLLQTELRASEEARRAEKLEVESLTDELTALYNRRAWNRLLAAEEERCRRYGHPAAVMVVDLDELKAVNDTHGHAAGDALIARAASALSDVVRTGDTVARVGGDEFAVLSAECDLTGGEALRERVINTLKQADIRASIGLALRDPSAGLLNAWEVADARMYEQKRAR